MLRCSVPSPMLEAEQLYRMPKITITETQTGVIHTLQTNDSGNSFLPDVPPGTYQVTSEASGFKKETRRNITVLVDTSTRIDVQLQTGNITETIEVTGAAPILQTDTASTASQINNQTGLVERSAHQFEPQFPKPS